MNKLVIPKNSVIEGDITSITCEDDIQIEGGTFPPVLESVSGGIQLMPDVAEAQCRRLAAPSGHLEVEMDSLTAREVTAKSAAFRCVSLQLEGSLTTEEGLHVEAQGFTAHKIEAETVEIKAEKVKVHRIEAQGELVISGDHIQVGTIKAGSVTFKNASKVEVKNIVAQGPVTTNSGKIAIKHLESPSFSAENTVTGIVMVATCEEIHAEGVRGFIKPDELEVFKEAGEGDDEDEAPVEKAPAGDQPLSDLQGETSTQEEVPVEAEAPADDGPASEEEAPQGGEVEEEDSGTDQETSEEEAVSEPAHSWESPRMEEAPSVEEPTSQDDNLEADTENEADEKPYKTVDFREAGVASQFNTQEQEEEQTPAEGDDTGGESHAEMPGVGVEEEPSEAAPVTGLDDGESLDAEKESAEVQEDFEGPSEASPAIAAADDEGFSAFNEYGGGGESEASQDPLEEAADDSLEEEAVQDSSFEEEGVQPYSFQSEESQVEDEGEEGDSPEGEDEAPITPAESQGEADESGGDDLEEIPSEVEDFEPEELPEESNLEQASQEVAEDEEPEADHLDDVANDIESINSADLEEIPDEELPEEDLEELGSVVEDLDQMEQTSDEDEPLPGDHEEDLSYEGETDYSDLPEAESEPATGEGEWTSEVPDFAAEDASAPENEEDGRDDEGSEEELSDPLEVEDEEFEAEELGEENENLEVVLDSQSVEVDDAAEDHVAVNPEDFEEYSDPMAEDEDDDETEADKGEDGLEEMDEAALIAQLNKYLDQIKSYFPDGNYPKFITQVHRYVEERRYAILTKERNKDAVVSSFDRLNNEEISATIRDFYNLLDRFQASRN